MSKELGKNMKQILDEQSDKPLKKFTCNYNLGNTITECIPLNEKKLAEARLRQINKRNEGCF